MADKVLIVSVSNKTLSRILGYKDGTIRDAKVKYSDGYSMVDFVVEHESGKEPCEGDFVPITDVFKER